MYSHIEVCKVIPVAFVLKIYLEIGIYKGNYPQCRYQCTSFFNNPVLSLCKFLPVAINIRYYLVLEREHGDMRVPDRYGLAFREGNGIVGRVW